MAMAITDIRAQLALGGARPTLFSVALTSPPGGLSTTTAAIAKVPFLVQAASIPESSLGTIQIPYFGRKVKVPGDRTYQPWSIQVLVDEDYILRDFFETWMASINSPIGNLRTFSTAATALAQATAQVTQYSKTGTILRIYQMDACWPSEVSPIELAWGANDTIEVFNVVFQYDEWTVIDGITGDAGGT